MELCVFPVSRAGWVKAREKAVLIRAFALLNSFPSWEPANNDNFSFCFLLLIFYDI